MSFLPLASSPFFLQFFSPLAKVKEDENGVLELEPVQSNHRDAFVNIAAGANEEVK